MRVHTEKQLQKMFEELFRVLLKRFPHRNGDEVSA